MNLVNELRERKSERERQKIYIYFISLSLFFSINDAEKGKYVKQEIYVN